MQSITTIRLFWTVLGTELFEEIISHDKKFDFQLTFVPPFEIYSHIVTALIWIGELFCLLRTVMRLLMVTDGSK
jgi:hypothetical protein